MKDKKKGIIILSAVVVLLSITVTLYFSTPATIEDVVARKFLMGFADLEMLRHFYALSCSSDGNIRILRAEYRKLDPLRVAIPAGTLLGVVEYRGSYARVIGIHPYFGPVWVPRITLLRI